MPARLDAGCSRPVPKCRRVLQPPPGVSRSEGTAPVRPVATMANSEEPAFDGRDVDAVAPPDCRRGLQPPRGARRRPAPRVRSPAPRWQALKNPPTTDSTRRGAPSRHRAGGWRLTDSSDRGRGRGVRRFGASRTGEGGWEALRPLAGGGETRCPQGVRNVGTFNVETFQRSPRSHGLEVAVHEADRDGPLPDRGRHPAHHAMAHVAGGEDARDAGLEQEGVALEGPVPRPLAFA